MAVLFRALLLLLPLLFVSAFARIPFFDPFNSFLPNPGYNEPYPDATTDALEKPDVETSFLGAWKIDSENAGVSAMHIQLLPNNKAVWFDTTDLGPSAIKLPPGQCRVVDAEKNIVDCWAHGVEYDIETANIRTLKPVYTKEVAARRPMLSADIVGLRELETLKYGAAGAAVMLRCARGVVVLITSDTWCSAGGLSPDGDLINAGGANGGIRGLRMIAPCEDCEFKENPAALSAERWYSTTQKLEDGRFVVVGGRWANNYDIIPPNSLNFPIKQIGLPFLEDTTDAHENNLYPFVYLIPDGNLFIFANNRAIIIDPNTGKTVRELPVLPGGARNYPSSGMSALLPITLNSKNPNAIDVEVLVCGGNKPEAYQLSMNEPRKFLPALQDCGRISVTKKNAKWEIEEMPSRRVMGDLLILPTGDLLMINGAQAGTAAWFQADIPNLTPVIYSPRKNRGERMKELEPTTIPRMYHSSSAVLPDGQVLVAGSNTNPNYDFNAKFPTELRVEKFAPPYLDPELNSYRPEIVEDYSDSQLNYGQQFKLHIVFNWDQVEDSDIKVMMLSPPFTTHGFSQNQRMLVLGKTMVTRMLVMAVAPSSGTLAPPGYYLLFVVHRGVPSRGMWVKIQ
ncbi:unnamed protein product [Ilex paraguariensis]|uniref:Uncharacterized protein n=1 Tax=Ilex paraguariensis TaxID=185542 RepID=A0ABC8TY48_9AQUA